MAKYFIDVNLPYRFSVWHGEEYIHARDLGDSWSDSQIWSYARERDLTIVSKDADFSERALLWGPPPRVIHIRFGNLRMRDFHRHVCAVWPEVCHLSGRCRLVNVFEERIE